mgnify:CR=1 FL=1
MAVSIRLSRGGAKKRPYYKIVVADARNSRDGKFIERIGSYNPLLAKDNPERVKLDADRARHWLSVGAQPSDRVARFLDAAGIRGVPQRLRTIDRRLVAVVSTGRVQRVVPHGDRACGVRVRRKVGAQPLLLG